jgi:opacity protein-like surface antigen
MPVRIRIDVYVLGVSLLTAMSLVAQDYPKVEIPIGFSFVNVHPGISSTPTVNPLTSTSSINISTFNIFGGGGQFNVNIGPVLGLKADFMGYTQGNGLRTKLTNAGFPIFGDVQGNLFTYMFGPQFKKHSGNWQPFGEALFGGAHSKTFASIGSTITGTTTGSASNNAFAMAFGGGLDYRVGRNVQIRFAEVDYLYTRFSINGAKNSHSQNNFRYVGGLNLTFGGAPPVPPTATCSANPATVTVGEPVTVTARPGGFNPKHTLTYAWSLTGGKLENPSAATTKVDTTGMSDGTHTANATITDPKGPKLRNVANCGANFNVNVPHNPPQVTCQANPTTVKSGETSTITANAVSPDKAEITGYTYSATAGTISGTGTSATLDTTGLPGETVSVTVTATDSRGLTGRCTTQVGVIAEIKCVNIEDWGECTFEKNPKKPWRVDNDCKDTLDKLSLRLQQMPNGKLDIVGYTNQAEVVKEQTLGAQRSVNVKYYLTTDGPNKVDPSRVQPRQGEAKGQATHFYFVPEGKLCGGQVEEGTVVDESQVQPQSRTAPAPKKKHKKAPAEAPAQ